MVHRTDNFWGFKTGMITEKSLLKEQGSFLRGWFKSRGPDRNKALVPRCPLSPSFKHASCMHYNPATICLLQETHKISILHSISFSGGSWRTGMGIHKGPKCGDLSTWQPHVFAGKTPLLPPPAACTSWNKLKSPSYSCSLCNFDSVSRYEFRTLYGAIWITNHLYLLLFYGNSSILRNNLLMT